MKTATIHAAFDAPALYTWGAAVTLRHLDPAKDGLPVQFGGTDRFADAYEAELVIAEKIAAGAEADLPGYAVGDIDVFRFTRASDAALS